MKRKPFGIACVLVVFLVLTTKAADFPVDIDNVENHPDSQLGVRLRSWALNDHPWRSVGFHDAGNHLIGGYFPNQTGVDIVAIRIKVNDGFAHRFIVNASSGHDAFDTIRVSPDGKEVYFLDGNIPNGSNGFWMQLPANSQSEQDDCDDPDHPRCPFSGQAYSNTPNVPNGYIRVNSLRDGLTEKWRDLRDKCPSNYRRVDLYGESPDGNLILYLSKGRLIMYDAKGKWCGLMDSTKTETALANRIAYENNSFALYRSGRLIEKIKPSESKSREFRSSDKTNDHHGK